MPQVLPDVPGDGNLAALGLFGAIEGLERELRQASEARRAPARPFAAELVAVARVMWERLREDPGSREAQAGVLAITVLVLELELKLRDVRCPPGPLRRCARVERARMDRGRDLLGWASVKGTAPRRSSCVRQPRARRSHARRGSTRTRAPSDSSSSGSSEPPGRLARGACRPSPLRPRARGRS
jgi:hypothetical protein